MFRNGNKSWEKEEASARKADESVRLQLVCNKKRREIYFEFQLDQRTMVNIYASRASVGSLGRDGIWIHLCGHQVTPSSYLEYTVLSLPFGERKHLLSRGPTSTEKGRIST